MNILENLDQFPQLKVQYEYVAEMETYVELLKTRMVFILNENVGSDKRKKNDNDILLLKTKFEIEGVERNIKAKTPKVNLMIETMEEVLKEMEEKFDEAMEKGKKKGLTMKLYTNMEEKVDLYLFFKKELENKE